MSDATTTTEEKTEGRELHLQHNYYAAPPEGVRSKEPNGSPDEFADHEWQEDGCGLPEGHEVFVRLGAMTDRDFDFNIWRMTAKAEALWAHAGALAAAALRITEARRLTAEKRAKEAAALKENDKG
jgi:hypothetical protein